MGKKIIDLPEISIPFNIKIEDKEVTHTFIQGTVGTGMSSYAAVIDSYIRKGPYKPFKLENKNKRSKVNNEIGKEDINLLVNMYKE